MKYMIVFALALVAFAVAVPVDKENVEDFQLNNEQNPDGSFIFGFKTDGGTVREEEGKIKVVLDEDNKPHNVVVVRGSYSYSDDNGKLETINYYADENGYHAEGPSIPKRR